MTVAVPGSIAALPRVVGAALRVPLVTGGRVEYANLDHAASAPCLEQVCDAVDELLPWYASVHRGAGFASRVSTRVYEQARDSVRRFVGARTGDTVVFTRNTTDSLNLLARSLPRRTAVVLFDTEHHAALLPWRGPNVRRLRTPGSPAAAVLELDRALRAAPEGPRLVVVTGASNVTGEVWPVAELAAVARRHGARVALDAAQLAPHRPVDLGALDVDYAVLSGHKVYAPFGAGVLVGRADWLQAADPYLVGGGATARVTDHGDRLGVAWSAVPERHEAGSPNVVGVHALAVACDVLGRHWEQTVAHERVLLARLRAGLATVPGARELSLFGPEHDRVGVVSFAVGGQDAGFLAAALSAEHGIGVRDGAFCAHVAVRRLTGGDRALRASLGLGSTAEHVDRFVAALRSLVVEGARWDYEVVDGRWAPVADDRALPPFLR
ncbi:aminotransferase class V-fold PLP-dependent enzyme [Saccharothrix algeriensis]|uniref:Aminotransferase class V-fold PLP-dependent enzyme n=1 Tax=Saccharothrix algeriensis TaxID=173560 RepID=A0A8T8HU98_9PSEU|nr:aminotransferase class V-fold PLP-dependent enzyme [Saccharothrix algeriensis]MBM7813571.1 selenocysteine lyase/cysteine desulfurase [Saccharothrix algeriensis]QTR02066.1 aminotransferase class V-fold PLP-dependent enzyme [Saccharothrix algeriensis]